MYQYEVMLVVDGTLTPEEANQNIETLKQPFVSFTDFAEQNIWNAPLVYEIKKKKVGHRYIFTFQTEQHAILDEFKKQALYNKRVLRVLIINLEKCYGYKASKNSKKLSIFKHKQKKYLNHLAAKAAAAELEGDQNVFVTEAGLRKVRSYGTNTSFIKTKKIEGQQ